MEQPSSLLTAQTFTESINLCLSQILYLIPTTYIWKQSLTILSNLSKKVQKSFKINLCNSIPPHPSRQKNILATRLCSRIRKCFLFLPFLSIYRRITRACSWNVSTIKWGVMLSPSIRKCPCWQKKILLLGILFAKLI